MKRFLSLLLAAALLGCAPARAEAYEPPVPDDLFVLTQASESGDVMVYDRSEPVSGDGAAEAPLRLRSALRAGVGLPSSYDPRKTDAMPPIRSQGTWNTCWAVAAMSAAELAGLKAGLLPYTAETVDLSERHLIYFFTHETEDPLGNSSGDYNVNPSFWLRSGGNPILAAMTMAGWHGPADEGKTDSAYRGLRTEDSLDPAYAYVDEMHLENTYVLNVSSEEGRSALKQMLLTHGGAVMCMNYMAGYLYAGPVSGPPTPTPAPTPTPEPTPGETPEPDDTPEPAVTADPEATPTSDPDLPPTPTPDIMTTPPPEPTPVSTAEPVVTPAPEPVATPEPAAEPGPGTDGDPEPEAPGSAYEGAEDYTVCYYQNVIADRTSHEVTVVGWDDNYPAQTFGWSDEGAVPPADGAWLCRNSYGASWAGGDGYFWVSYYDACVACDMDRLDGRITVFEFGPADNYDNNYEYDGAVVMGYVNDTVEGRGVSTSSAAAGSKRWYANVFTACGSASPRGYELLRAVSTYTYRASVPYTARVYTGLTDPADPASGNLAAEVSGRFDRPGLHTVPLPEPVTLAEGESFSVVFSVSRAADRYLFVPACYTSASWYSVNDSAPGQSFISMDGGTWYDCQEMKNKPNVRIKAYTDNALSDFPFGDVAANAWYRTDVETGWLSGLLEGMSADVFWPEGCASRAQVTAVLHRLTGNESAAAAEFDDVPSAAWYHDDVAWARARGVVLGSDDDGDGVYSFRPEDPVTREELAAILCRAAEAMGHALPAAADLTAFADGEAVSDWAREDMGRCAAAGLLYGVPDGASLRLDPQGTVTRAQLAAFLTRLASML